VRSLALPVLLLVLMLLAGASRAPQGTRFVAVDVVVDTGEAELAAWQVELVDTTGRAALVGVEGGDHDAFRDAPAHDPAALDGGRVVLASFRVDGELPRGRTRVATLSFAVEGAGEPRFDVTDVVAAAADGTPIDVTVEVLP